jgi:hypothetical protein
LKIKCQYCPDLLERLHQQKATCGACKNKLARQWIAANKERHKSLVSFTHMKRYGLTKADYFALFEKQNGKCAICKCASKNRKLCVDHCHASRKVRGLLYRNCNVALGLMKDAPERLRNAASYLENGFEVFL